VRFEVAYLQDGLVRSVESEQWEFLDKHNVLWVDVFAAGFQHRLMGADYYWAYENQYGVIYDGSCCEEGYATWQVMGRIVRTYDMPPEGAHMLVGVMVHNAEWERIRAH